jgi:hypothetical protein
MTQTAQTQVAKALYTGKTHTTAVRRTPGMSIFQTHTCNIDVAINLV